jgi:hypothetical protein
MPVERELRSSRRRFLGTMLGAACACGLAATATATPRARAEGSIARLDEPGTALQTAERLSLRPPPVPEGKLMFPVSPASDCYVLDNFGDARGSTRLHEGVDIMGSRDMPVFAVVVRGAHAPLHQYGHCRVGLDALRRLDQDHLQVLPPRGGRRRPERRQLGVASQTIGYVGNSGTAGEDNFHLHFEVRPNNVAVDPLPLLVVDPKACSVSPPIRA